MSATWGNGQKAGHVDITGQIIEVVVGQDEEIFNIHENVLNSGSDFFKAVLGRWWSEGREGLIELPEDISVVVQTYFHYLYTGKFSIDWTEDGADVPCDENLPEYFTLAHLYIFGEKVGDVSFKNAIVDLFLRRMNEKIRGARQNPITDVVDILYQGTTPTSPIRSLVVECHFHKGGQMWISENSDENNKEFLMDLTRAFLRNDQAKRDPKWFLSQGASGAYHEDAQVEREVGKKAKRMSGPDTARKAANVSKQEL